MLDRVRDRYLFRPYLVTRVMESGSHRAMPRLRPTLCEQVRTTLRSGTVGHVHYLATFV